MPDARRFFDDIEVGEAYESPGRTVTETDIVLFAGLSGDYNVLHTDAEFMKQSIFGERIAHGLLGLSIQAGLFTGSLATALRVSRELEFGGVTINEAPTFRADQMPYGGVKDSGNTREGPAWAVREMTEERLVVVQT